MKGAYVMNSLTVGRTYVPLRGASKDISEYEPIAIALGAEIASGRDTCFLGHSDFDISHSDETLERARHLVALMQGIYTSRCTYRLPIDTTNEVVCPISDTSIQFCSYRGTMRRVVNPTKALTEYPELTFSEIAKIAALHDPVAEVLRLLVSGPDRVQLNKAYEIILKDCAGSGVSRGWKQSGKSAVLARRLIAKDSLTRLLNNLNDPGLGGSNARHRYLDTPAPLSDKMSDYEIVRTMSQLVLAWIHGYQSGTP